MTTASTTPLDSWSPEHLVLTIWRKIRKNIGMGYAYDCPAYNSSLLRWTLFLTVMALHVLVPARFVLFVVTEITSRPEFIIPGWTAGILFGFWTIYKNIKWIAQSFIVSVTPGEHWVLANFWTYEEIGDPLERLNKGFRQILAGMREYTSGWHIKFPWEKIVEEWKVKLGAELIIEGRDGQSGNKSEIEFYTKAGPGGTPRKKVLARWKIIATPLAGYLANYVLFKESFRDNFIRTDALRLLNELIGNRTYTEFEEEVTSERMSVNGKPTLTAEFANLFEGPDTVSDKERRIGMFTGSPEVYDFQLDIVLEKLLDQANVLEAVRTATERMFKQFKGTVTREECLRAVLQAMELNSNTRQIFFNGNQGQRAGLGGLGGVLFGTGGGGGGRKKKRKGP